jgi:hypothetical protein
MLRYLENYPLGTQRTWKSCWRHSVVPDSAHRNNCAG